MTEPKPLKFKKLGNFLSEKQLTEHHDVLYVGYCKKIAEIREKLKTIEKDANATYSHFRALKIAESFAWNGVLLHEAYFENLGGDGKVNGAIFGLIKRDFGSFEKWVEDFKACCMSARGWVVLVYDLNDKKLHNYICDAHNQFGIWGAIPLVVMDMYEHAYFIDYGTNKKAYIDLFMSNLDFEYSNSIIKRFKLA